MKTLIILGNDRLSQLAISKIGSSDNLCILIDRSTNLKRIYKLVIKKKITLSILIKMFFCELQRKKFNNLNSFESIRNNKTLLDYIKRNNIKKIILFRAGLIINKVLIKKRITILNIHAAKVPKYGGIGSIQKALKDKDFNQYASLHHVTTAIDKGKVLDKEKYKLLASKSYCFNENIAYQSALKLLCRTLLQN